MANRAIRQPTGASAGQRGNGGSTSPAVPVPTEKMPRKNTKPVKPRVAQKTNGEKRAPSDRRSPDRGRAPSVGNSGPTRFKDAPISEYKYYLPQNLNGMALFFLLAFVIAAGVARAVPDTPYIVAAACAVGLLFSSKFLATIERRADTAAFVRQLILLFGIVTPMGLAGAAFAGWVEAGLAWQWAVASLVCINAASAAVFGSRIVSW